MSGYVILETYPSIALGMLMVELPYKWSWARPQILVSTLNLGFTTRWHTEPLLDWANSVSVGG